MKNKVNESSCPSCGATMRYNPEVKYLYCDNCKTQKHIKRSPVCEKHIYSEEKLNADDDFFNKQVQNLNCPNCGAQVVLNILEYSKTCPYCNSNLVSSVIEKDIVTPDAIIPFTFSNEEASKKYIQGTKKKWFLPNKFKKAPPVENIKGIYIPVFCFDADTKSKYSGVLEYEEDISGHKRIRTKHISGKKESLQKDILVETSSKIHQYELEDIKPFDLSKAVKFDQGFILGYTVEHYNDILKKCKKQSEEIMKQNIENEILAGYSYDRVESFTLETEFSNEKYLYYLLPVYKCEYTYKKKIYTTFMNGLNGNVGGGQPKSAVKITFFVLTILLIIAAVFFFDLYFN